MKLKAIRKTNSSNMIKDSIHTTELLTSLRKTTTHFLYVLNRFSGQNINIIPFEGSWTAAQVADHITRSNTSITKALQLSGSVINRDAGERVQELKDVFLDYKTKFKSPGFILPTRQTYEKETLVAGLEHSIEKLKEVGATADLSEMINHPAFGDITKYEILHFVLYHTQRHTHQLQNIFRAITERRPQ